MNGLICYYDTFRRQWVYDRGGLASHVLVLPKRKLMRFRLQAVKQRPFAVDSAFKAASADAADLTEFDDSVFFSFKTLANYESGGDFAYAAPGVDLTAGWESAVAGRHDVEFAIPGVVAAGPVVAAITMFKQVGNSVEFGNLRAFVEQDVYTGDEGTPPAGAPAASSGTAIITAGNTLIVVAKTGMTATGIILPSLLSVSELTTISATPGTNQFTINIGGTYDTDVTVGYYITRLSA